MGYENGLITDAPEVSLPGGGGEWEGQGGLSTSESPEVKAAIAFAKATWNAYKPIRWQDESGMQAVTQTQKTVVVPVKITKKPRGSFFNTKYGTIQPGDVVMEVARGTASNVPNSYVMWGGISGWVRTGELKAIVRDMGPELDWDPQWYPAYENGKAVAKTKLPVLPLAAIGYFLLNR